jgi:hypothetical protein
MDRLTRSRGGNLSGERVSVMRMVAWLVWRRSRDGVRERRGLRVKKTQNVRQETG